MPPESIGDGVFTEKSDVVSATNTAGLQHASSFTLYFNLLFTQWSFGVTCWEVFTRELIPYGGISPMALLQLLRSGERFNNQ